MAVIKTKIVFDVSPAFRERWLRLCEREHLTQAEMFRRMVAEREDTEMTKQITWTRLEYRAVSAGLVDAGTVDDIIQSGPDFDGEPDEIVSESTADNEYGVGYHNGRPCLYSPDEGGYGYYVPAGFAYEQPRSGYTWEAVS